MCLAKCIIWYFDINFNLASFLVIFLKLNLFGGLKNEVKWQNQIIVLKHIFTDNYWDKCKFEKKIEKSLAQSSGI